jgi:hypothetical protein
MNAMRIAFIALLATLASACQSTVVADIAANGDSDIATPGDGDPSSPSGDAPAGGDTTPVISSPASTWLGMNVSGDLPRADITDQLQPFDTDSAAKDSNGYPIAGASGTSTTDIGFALPSGTYKVSYKGAGTLTIGGDIATMQGTWQTDAGTGEHRGTLAITGTPGSFGHFLTLAITNSQAQTVTDIHIYLPGIDYDPPSAFTPQLIALLAPFRAMRFMDWMATNGSTIVDWADRPRASQFGASPYGAAYEHLVELVNITGKDMWINIPEHASDDFIQSLAEYLNTNLDMGRIGAARAAQGVTTPFEIIIENSNETWNNGFTAYATFLSAAKSAAAYGGAYDGTYGPDWMAGNEDLMTVGRYEADRLVKIGNTFRSVFTDHPATIAPVLAGWALGAVYTDAGLRYVKAHYGEPKNYFKYIAMAPYFGPANDDSTATMAGVFSACAADINSMGATFTEFKNLAADYGLEMSAYEGGQGMTGTTNQRQKHLAQHDKRMYDTYTAYYAFWQQHFGKALFMHFTLAGTPGAPELIFQYGYWGAASSIMDDPTTCGKNLPTFSGSETVSAQVTQHCAKYQASVDAALK